MDTSRTRKASLRFLMNEGFRPSEDNDGYVIFKYEGRAYYMRLDGGRPTFFTLALPAFWSLDDEEEAQQALTIGNEVHQRVHGPTVVISAGPEERKAVSVVCELFLVNPDEDVPALFYPCLASLQAAAQLFKELMNHRARTVSPFSVTSATEAVGGYNGNGGYL
jgi:hypothetical protein